MKTAELVKPNYISECTNIESPYDLYSYSEICLSHCLLIDISKLPNSKLKMACYHNKLYSIKKRNKSKPAIKFKSFKNTNKLKLNRRCDNGF